MSRVRVYIATTQGASQVEILAREEQRPPEAGHEIFSDIFLGEPYQKLPIAGAYKDFVRKPSGVIEKLFGHSVFMLQVSHPIVDGESWKLGAFAAHALQHEGRLAMRDEPADEVIWLTGTVRRDDGLTVGSIDHLEQKIESSTELFQACSAAGLRVTLFLPEGDLESLDPDWLRIWRRDARLDEERVAIVPVRSAFDLAEPLGLAYLGEQAVTSAPRAASSPAAGSPSRALVPGAAAASALDGTAAGRERGWYRGLAIVLLLTALGVGASFLGVENGNDVRQRRASPERAADPAAAESPRASPSPGALDTRPGNISSLPAPGSLRLDATAELQPGRFACVQGRGDVATKERSLARRPPDGIEAVTNESLCAVHYRVTNTGSAPLYVELQIFSSPLADRDAQLRRGLRASDRLAAGGSLSLPHRIPPTGFRGERHRIVAAASREALPDLSALFPPADAGAPDAWRRLEARLEEQGIRLASATHEIAKKPRYR